MKRFLKVLLLFSLLTGRLFAYTPSETAQISVIICSPGEELYSRFGHAALRLCDTAQNIDAVFDYGTFMVESVPSFVWNFLTGEMYYLLDTRGFRETVKFYEMEHRTMTEYTLLLTKEEKENICDRLITNLQPRNKAYLYNFFEDNCATRIRDIMVDEVPTIGWNTSYERQTWRQTVIDAIGTTSWTSFGINLGLGAPADTLASAWQMMYLPAVLGQSCASATRADGTNVCLSPTRITPPQTFGSFSYDDPYAKALISAGVLADPEESDGIEAWLDNSPLILWILAILFAAQTIRECVTKKRCVWCDVVFFFAIGLVGITIWFISLFSVHSLVFPNYNMLWLNPFHLIFASLYIVPKWREYTQWYFYLAAIEIVLYVPISLFIGQFIPPASWPLLLVIVLRSISLLANSCKLSCNFIGKKEKKL